MSMALMSLLFLVGAIALGFFRKVNVGLISIAGALLLGLMLGMKDAAIIKGFNAGLFITLMGVTFLFSILNTNGTIEIMAQKIVTQVGKRNWLIPIAVFAVGFVLTTIGPGAIPMLAIMPAFAIPIAIVRGYHPIMLALIADFGVFSGRMSNITPEGILVRNLLAQGGVVAGIDLPLYCNQVLTGIVCAIIAFIYYKGYKVQGSDSAEGSGNLRFSKKQFISLAGLIVMVVLVIGLKFNVGLVSFAIGALLLCLKVSDEGKSIRGIPWGVLIMVSGVGTLMELVIKTGGITLLSNTLAATMNSYTASAIMGITAGVMSWFSSGLGVVFPTLIPTVSSVAQIVGANVDPRELASLIVIGGTFTGVSPFSTTGGLIVATVMTEEGSSGKENENKLFIELLIWSVITIVVLALLALLGVYKLFL
jgi:di/tricarboxylate transporter